ncbi:hypothetical protein BUALT_Bualt18G0075700 [Buddleja alternifolia]|uniref:Uncharacterized protein n=1 Tax=Buddleja alternifolia TaxID=168488 RepID=A0AAV6W510_9LAMI|nr:hypothetical protein BUALT_Bualt18G0075700 [Buddleja alternifolia]
MATRKEAAQPQSQGRSVVEEERVEKELDKDAISRLCHQHCGGVPASHGVDDRKPTVECTGAEFDDGSDDASTAGKCKNINQQADHFKCPN